ncbi:hypothetical protein AB832_02820 [Flavobacteriaceae bacterium (ex Bugula neritina AB1)]|nr:hypothetical protein AB832_02820 [Flavobacteriaceae bacterium (ex Bugula neritina AB1)]
MKIKSILQLGVYLFLGIYFCNAQNMSVLGGVRDINLNNWDFPTIETVYQDRNGVLYFYIDEPSWPRNSELIRFNETSNNFEDLTKHNFNIPGGVSNSSGVGLSDGSIMTATYSFSQNHWTHRYYPDGRIEDIGSNPLNGQFFVKTFLLPNGDLYYSHCMFYAGFRKLVENSWVDLPNISNRITRRIDLAHDEHNNIYAAYEADLDHVEVKVFDGSKWELIFEETDLSSQPNLHIVSSREIYMSYYNDRVKGVLIKKYNGTSWTPIGSSVPILDFGLGTHNDIIMNPVTQELFVAEGGYSSLYRYDKNRNRWESLINESPDGGRVSGFKPILHITPEGILYNTFKEDKGITILKYESEKLGRSKVSDVKTTPKIDVFQSSSSKNIINLINNSEIDITKAKIWDSNGREVFSRKVDGLSKTHTQLQVDNLLDGIYFLGLENKNANTVFTKTIHIKN